MSKKSVAFFTLLLSAGILFTPTFGKTRSSLTTPVNSAINTVPFPENFLWGAASAAQHVEHQQPSDWTAFEKQVIQQGLTATDPRPGYALPGHINSHDRYSALVRQKKTDYDARYPEDFALANQLGHNTHRFSISWARLFPRAGMAHPDPEAINFYDNILDNLEKHQIIPFVTLFHFSTPAWFWEEKNGARGWEREDALDHFARFVEVVIAAYGDRITLWTTLNEPMTYIFNGYMEGIFPPLETRDVQGVAPVVEKLLQAHALAYRLIHADAQRKKRSVLVGIAKHTRAFEPLRNWAPLDRLSAATIEQAFIWDFLDAINSGTLKLTNTAINQPIHGLAGTQDYVGVNYYGRYYVESNILDLSNPTIHFYDPKNNEEVRSDLDWAVHPRGFYNILTATHHRYKKPIYVLENGLADSDLNDVRRQKFMVSHIREMSLAMQTHEVDIRGYIHWALTDNFEWAEGFTARFGMIHINYENDFHRQPRPSAYLYKQIIQERGISAAMWRQYGPREPGG